MIHVIFPAAGHYVGTVICPTGSASSLVARSWVSVRATGGGELHVFFQRSAVNNDPAPGTGKPWEGPWPGAQRVWAEIPDGTEYIEYDITVNGPGALLVEQMAK